MDSLTLIAVIVLLGAWFYSPIVKWVKKSNKTQPAILPPRKRKAPEKPPAPQMDVAKSRPKRKHYNDDEVWDDVPISQTRPAGNWVFQPKEQFAKLVTISIEPEQFEARQVLIKAAERHKSYTLTALREPENPYDADAIAIYLETPNYPKSKVGYVSKDPSKALARDFSPNMPISVMLYAMRTNGEAYYLNIRILIPGKKERAAFER